MARRPAPFRKADIVLAVKTARDLGIEVAGFELGLEGRTIKIVERTAAIPTNPFDQWKAKRHANQAEGA